MLSAYFPYWELIILWFFIIFYPGKSDATYLAGFTERQNTFTRAEPSKPGSTKTEFCKVKQEKRDHSPKKEVYHFKDGRSPVLLVWIQCDHTGRFFALWATFQSLWQQLFSPNRPHSYVILVNVSKIFHFSSEIIFGNFYIWRFFIGDTVWIISNKNICCYWHVEKQLYTNK